MEKVKVFMKGRLIETVSSTFSGAESSKASSEDV